MRTWWMIIVISLISLVSMGYAQGNKGGNGGNGGGGGAKGQCRGGTEITDPFPLTVFFRDRMDGETPDRIQSDGAPYGPDGTAKMTCTGEIEVSAFEPSIRTMFFDFRDPEPPGPAPCEPDCWRDYETIHSLPPFLMRTNVYADLPGDPDEDGGMLVGGACAIPVGEARRSRLKINYSAASGDLTIRFKPDEFEDTDSVEVKRTSETTWEIEAMPEDVAKLMTPNFSGSSGGRRKTRGHDEGNYHLPFKVFVSTELQGVCAAAAH